MRVQVLPGAPTKKIMIYILLPAYNEEKNLKKMFQKIEKIYLKKLDITAVLIDDCSTDNTILLKKKTI